MTAKKKSPYGDAETLTASDIAIARGLGGSIDAVTLLRAHVIASEGENRAQQEDMVRAVTDSIKRGHPLLVQAGTGTGKSLAYLFAIAASGKRAVIATATNQLSEQLIGQDLPAMRLTLEDSGQDVSYAMLKGRNQYLCLARVDELRTLNARARVQGILDEQDRLFDIPDEIVERSKMAARKKDSRELTALMNWSQKTISGERNAGPMVSDSSWNQVSVTNMDCVGHVCPFFDQCFTELARKRARAATIVVTNHALLAQDIKAGYVAEAEDPAGGGGVAPTLFGPHEILVVDEAHAFPQSLTQAFSRDFDPATVDKFLRKSSQYLTSDVKNDQGESVTVSAARGTLDNLSKALLHLPQGPLMELPADVTGMLTDLTIRLINVQRLLNGASSAAVKTGKSKKATAITLLSEQSSDIAEVVSAARGVREGMVRWVDSGKDGDRPVLRIAPVHVGDMFAACLEGRTLIATSATLASGKDFAPLARALGIEHATATDVGTPFDYRRQGMLYIPRPPFPAPIGKDRVAHKAAVMKELEILVRAAGGRTLALFTTTAEAQKAADFLRVKFPMLNVYAHGDASADILVRQFREDETSVLCATMGLWQGVSIEGASCSLVVIDKISFAPVDDVLTAARRAHVDAQGRDGFHEVIVSQAATSLSQGIGRLIRRADDKGIAVVLDPRIWTKPYGRTLLAGLPDFPRFTDRDVVVAALTRLTGGLDEHAVRPEVPTDLRQAAEKREIKPRKKPPARAATTRKIASRPIRRRGPATGSKPSGA